MRSGGFDGDEGNFLSLPSKWSSPSIGIETLTGFWYGKTNSFLRLIEKATLNGVESTDAWISSSRPAMSQRS